VIVLGISSNHVAKMIEIDAKIGIEFLNIFIRY
jgi:hypothetical protein